VKLLNDIAIRPFLSGKSALLLSGLLMLNACAAIYPEKITPPPLDHPTAAVQLEEVDVLEVTPEMEAFLERYILKYKNAQTRMELLTSTVARSGTLGFQYDEDRTLTAAQAFKSRSGNCIGFSNMMIALARRAGLKARYQEVFLRPEWTGIQDDTVLLVKHVNVVISTRELSWVVDVSGLDITPTSRRRIIDDSYAKALYLNNIAVESLLENDLPTAYAYMTSAIAAESSATDPWVNLGVVYGRNEQLDDAAFALHRALQIEPRNRSALSNLYEVYIEQENFKSAAELELKVEKYRMKNPYYLLKLSDEALVEHQYEESINLLQKAIRKKKNDHKLHFALAKTQYLSGDMEDAESSLIRARELAPRDMMVNYGRPLEALVADQ
jgi:Flp pilus assembly protein TadD